MTRRALFVQGGGTGVHDGWDDKLVQSLERELGESYAIRYPRMPNEHEPNYPAWKAALMNEFSLLKDGAILVGHSIGATILLHTLTEQPPTLRVGGLFLIATPFIGAGGWPSDDMQPRLDLSERRCADAPIFLYHGTEDDIVPVAHVHLYARALPHAIVRTCEHNNHQLNNDLSQVARDIRSLT